MVLLGGWRHIAGYPSYLKMAARLFRYFILYPILLVITGLIVLVLWICLADPLSVLPGPQHILNAGTEAPVTYGGRKLQHIQLPGGELGNIGIVVSLPDPLPVKKLPILVVLGGLGTGENNIRSITNPGDNAVIGYDWPMPVDFPRGNAFIRQMPDLYRNVTAIPGQIATAIDYLAMQPWADNQRISILGFSLGALATPVAENVTEHQGHKIGWTIIAYGGAPFGALFASNPHMKPKWIGPVIDVLLHPLQPTVNLPYLTSHFLVLEGRNDALIPAEARITLREAVPDPKDVVIFNGDHMGVGADKQALLDQIIRTSREWLVRNKAVNAPQ